MNKKISLLAFLKIYTYLFFIFIRNLYGSVLKRTVASLFIKRYIDVDIFENIRSNNSSVTTSKLYVHKKNGFAEASTNLARYRSEK